MLFMIPAFNPFVPNAPFLYPLKTSENRKVFLCFQGVEKGCIGNKWVDEVLVNASILYPRIIPNKTKSFLVFSGSIKCEHWLDMG